MKTDAIDIKVSEEIARLKPSVAPIYNLVKMINEEYQKKKSPNDPNIDVNLIFEYGEGTWDSCAALWVGDKSIGPTEHRLLVNGILPIKALKKSLREEGYRTSHEYGVGNLPKNIIKLSVKKYKNKGHH